jgi:hypothetical protein
MARARLLFVAVVFLVLQGLAHGAAELRPHLAPWMGPAESVLDYRILFTDWVAVALLAPALCFYIFARSGERNSYWRGFWTAAWLAYLVHLGWSAVRLLAGPEGAAAAAEVNFQALRPLTVPLVLAVWWALDVLLAWASTAPNKAVSVERGLVHLFAFALALRDTVLTAAPVGVMARLLGVALLLAVLASFVIRLIVRESDPHSLLTLLYVKAFQVLNLFVPWHRLPTFLGVANLGALREVLRARNLHDTSGIPVSRPQGLAPAKPFEARYLVERELDGQYDDLSPGKELMGSASNNPTADRESSDFTRSNPGARFGRNIPLDAVGPLPSESLLDPNPRQISNELLARPQGAFTPASTLNLLAAAWIQFQTHDWFNHGNPVRGRELEVPVTGGDWHESPMRVRWTRPDPTRSDATQPYPPGGPQDGQKATYANAESHWWDASQIYGSSAESAAALRDSKQKGRLRLDSEDLLLLGPGSMEVTGLTVNWWLGLSLLHNLFTQEHNAICARLERDYPHWDGDQLYRVARLVNSALMAKIHTVEWTPAIVAHPALKVAMNANWWGLAGPSTKKSLGRISTSEAVSGIPGSETNHHGADYCLTEEFVSVYRMHPLLPDGLELRSVETGGVLWPLKFGSEKDDDPDDVVGPQARAHALAHGTMADLFYSFGVSNPGALVLRNFPNWMRRLKRRRGAEVDEIIDLATIDVLRDRERGVPRYNRFRELFHLPRFRSIDQVIAESRQLRSDPELAGKFKAIYRDNIDLVDLMVGMYAETPPEGFGFSDTAFRVFILMASRRLKSDRFITNDFSPTLYTQAGIDWINDNGMVSVLLRHYPQLAPSLRGVDNPFAPWKRLGGAPADYRD